MKLSPLALGTAHFGMDYGFDKALSQEKVNALLETCVDAGVHLIDTARQYGDSEKKIGRFLKAQGGSPLVVATKLAILKEGDLAGAASALKAIRSSVAASLENLQRESLDVLFSHQSAVSVLKRDVLWEAIGKLKREGLVKLFGVSLYETEELNYLLSERAGEVDVVQVPFNAFDQRFQPLLEKAQGAGIQVVARSVFMKGMIAASPERVPAELRGVLPHKKDLEKLAAQSDVSPVEWALAFVLKTKGIDSALLGMKSVEEVMANVDVLKQLSRLSWPQEKAQELAIKDSFLRDPRQWETF